MCQGEESHREWGTGFVLREGLVMPQDNIHDLAECSLVLRLVQTHWSSHNTKPEKHPDSVDV